MFSNFIWQWCKANTKRKISSALLLLCHWTPPSTLSSEQQLETRTSICKEGTESTDRTHLLNFCSRKISQHSNSDSFGNLEVSVFHHFFSLTLCKKCLSKKKKKELSYSKSSLGLKVHWGVLWWKEMKQCDVCVLSLLSSTDATVMRTWLQHGCLLTLLQHVLGL